MAREHHTGATARDVRIPASCLHMNGPEAAPLPHRTETRPRTFVGRAVECSDHGPRRRHHRTSPLPVPSHPDRSGETLQVLAGRWLVGGSADGRRPGEAIHEEHHPWHRVIWLTGVDYFSTLGYQPGIALIAAGILAPFATGVLVLVTPLGALPIYAQVARRSYAGQGSIAMLENLLPGWNGKLLVLALLGFAATDFVITMTLSAADAAKHAVENPLLHPFIGDHKLGISLLLLTLLAVVFLAGFREAIGAAMLVAVPYLALTLVVLMRGMIETFQRPEVWTKWHLALDSRGSHGSIALGALVVFP